MSYYYSKGLPTLYEIRKGVPNITSEPQLEAFFTNVIKVSDEQIMYRDLLVMVETLLKYRGMYSLDEYSEFIYFVLGSLELANYRLYRYILEARKKLDSTYRQSGRKKYIHFCISHSELGKDIADVICNFI